MARRAKKNAERLSRIPPKQPSRLNEQNSRKKAASSRAQGGDADNIANLEPAPGALINNLEGFVYSCENNPNWTMRYLSPQVETLLGYKPEELLNDGVIAYNDLIHPDDREEVWESIQIALADHERFGLEYRIRNKKGKYRWVHEEGAGVFEKGVLQKLEGYVSDITDRKRDEKSLHRLNRALRTLSRGNEALVRATDETDLLNSLCETITGRGGYKLAWVGYAENDKEKNVRPVAQSGFEQGYLKSIKVVWSDTKHGRGPTGTAIRTGKPVIARNILKDEHFAPWRKEARKRGYASSIALPLKQNEETFGALNIYAEEIDAFDLREVELLVELAEDLAFGIVALRTRDHRDKTLTELQQRTHDLEERIKEQNCLYRIHELLDNQDATVESIVSAAVEILPPGWLYPEITACRITVDGITGKTKNFKSTKWKLEEPITAKGKTLGTVEVVLLEKKPEEDIGPFLKEEKNLLKSVAGILGLIIYRIRIESEREEREIFIRTVMDSLPIGIAVNTIKPTVSFEYMNDNYLRFFRTTREAIAAPDSFWEAVYEDPEIREQIRRKVLDDATSNDPQRMDWEDVAITRKGEETTYISIRNTPIPDTNMIVSAVHEVTERKRAEVALRESEENYRGLFNSIRDAIVVVDINRTITDCNPAFGALFGYSVDEIRGKKTRILYASEEDYNRIGKVLYEKPGKDGLHIYTVRYRKKNGEEFFGESGYYYLKDDDGSVTGVIDLVRDISERIKAERELAASEQKFRSFVLNSSDAIYVLQDDRFVFVNPQFETLFHTSAEEVRTEDFDFREFISPEGLESIAKRGKRRERGESVPPTYEFRAKRKDGSILDVEVSVSEITYMGKPATLGVLRNITERKQAEQMQAWMTQSLEAAPLAVMLADPTGSANWINPQFTLLLGYYFNEVIKKPLTSFFDFSTSSLEIPEQLMTILCGKTGRWYGNISALAKNGMRIPAYLAAACVKDIQDNVLGFTVTMIDRRNLEELEKVKVRLENELNQQFHLSQVGLLTSGISHNLRNPLSVIMMGISQLQQSIEMILSKSPEDPVALYGALDNSTLTLEKVRTAADRINLIIDEIMAYHQMNTLVMGEATDLNHVIQTDVGLLKADLDFKHKIETVLDLLPGHVWVKMRPSEISQIFLNLTANARDAMMNGGQRVMTVRSGISGDGSEAWFEVQDTGTGIPPEIQEKIGQPFITTKRDDPKFKKGGSGTGLGLYMIKRLLDQHNGRYEIESKPGDTRFRIHLPATEQPAGEEE